MRKTSSDEPEPGTEHIGSTSGATGLPTLAAESDDSDATDPAAESEASAKVIPDELAAAFKSGDMGRIAAVIQTVASYSGPLPPPEMLRKYNDALPDGAKRIVSNWETESDHRRQLEARGQKFAFVVMLAAIVAGVGCALFDQPWVGGGIVLATMLGIGVAGALRFVTARRPGQ